MKMDHGPKTLALSLSLLLAFFLFFNVTHAKTLKVDTITPSVTNGDMTIGRNGTGDLVLSDFSGVLRASTGVVSAGNIDLASEVTGILPIANGGTGSSSQNFVDLTTAQTVAGEKTFDDALVMLGIATPSAPSAGDYKLYFKTDGSLYKQDSSGAEARVGGGGVGAPYIYEVTDFEGTVKAASFTCDTNLAAADDTSTPLNGLSSLTITQGATPPSVGAKCTGPNIAVPLGARNKTHVVYVPVVNGMNSGDLAVNIYDVTNTIELAQASLNASSEKKYQPIYFKTADDTANIRIEFEVLVQNGSTAAEFDDIFYQDRLDPVDVTSIVSNFRGEGNAAGSVTSSVTDVDFIEIIDSKGAWDGDQYTVQNSDSKIEISVGVSINTAALFSVDLYKNGTIYKNLASFSDAADSRNTGSYSSSKGEFSAGDVLSIRIDSTRTLANIPARHYLNITETAKENFVAVKGASTDADPQPWTPDIAGDSAETINHAKWYRDGGFLYGSIKFTLGSVAGSEFQIPLPNGYVLDSDYYNTTLVVSSGDHTSATTETKYVLLATGGDNFLNAALRNSSTGNGYTPQDANALFGNGNVINFSFKVKIQGWTSENITVLFNGSLYPPKASFNTATAPSVVYEIAGNTAYQSSQITAVTHYDSVFASVGSNQITLPSGTYMATIQAGGRSGTGAIDARLYDGSTTLSECQNIATSDTSTIAYSSGICYRKITLASETTFNFQLKSANANGQMAAYDLLIEKVR